MICILFTPFSKLQLLLVDSRHVPEGFLVCSFSAPLPDNGFVIFNALAVLTSQLEHLVLHLSHVLKDLVVIHACSEANDLR